MAYICPVCAFPDLPEPPENFSICPSCGTEFGFDDARASHARLRQSWIQAGVPWFSRARHAPVDWNPWLQLIKAGFVYDWPFQAKVWVAPQVGAQNFVSKIEGPVFV